MKEITDITLQQGATKFTFLPTGDLKEAYYQDIQINQVRGNVLDGSMQNIYLRIFAEDGTIQSFPLIGIQSKSMWFKSKEQLKWVGRGAKVDYEVLFTLADEQTWFWQVTVKGSGQTVDVIYGQDIGLASDGALRSNEAYVSQYIDHKVLEKDGGVILASRQNQAQDNRHPYLQQGLLSGAIGYVTDGFQFFGKSYKKTNQPEALQKEQLANEVYQYELAYTALQPPKTKLTGETTFVFYGFVQENHSEAVTQLEFKSEIEKAWQQCQKLTIDNQHHWKEINPWKKKTVYQGEPMIGDPLTETELAKIYPNRKLSEKTADGQLLSFFLPTNEHVVLQEKELLSERSHGHIIMTGKETSIKQPIMTSTSYMPGIFQAQTVLGNTTMNKFLSNVRNPLNYFKTSGQRIYLKENGTYHLLTMPSAYEIGFNYAKWIYKLADNFLTVTVYAHTDGQIIDLVAQSEQGKTYDWLVTQQVVLHDVEQVVPYQMEIQEEGHKVRFYPEKQGFVAEHYPNLGYELSVQPQMTIMQENEWFEQNDGLSTMETCFAFSVVGTPNLHIQTKGTLDGQFSESEQTFEKVKEEYKQYIAELNRHFEIVSESDTEHELERLNVIAWWYTHNMLVHYLVPHGLEQYGGAAWGTRDVCQGPAEYFLATQRYEVVREIIETVFSHQFIEDGNWSQWFMFDRYEAIMADESHGDVIVWPLKMLADYLEASGDFDILDVEIPFMSLAERKATSEKYSLREHVKRELAYITSHFLFGTALSCYGDGDWDDTLQPNESRLKSNMASTWTVALTYQTIRKFGRVLEETDTQWSSELLELARKINQDYRDYFLRREVLPGFALMEEPGKIEYIVHPEDKVTGISYRLLPMTRSMISELFTPEEMEQHLALIEEYLTFPDGVRLMNRPAPYQGGVSTYFKRAEQAANFGREIGLQYVHAHIRFTEAMAKIGREEKAWQALQTINPILIQEKVPNAEIRQSNSYFSSSDGKFNTRYEASEHFEQLKTSDVAVKGGWRVYSSGPGIYLNQLISNVLGIRIENQDLILDPVLPKRLGTVEVNYSYFDRPVRIIYHLDYQGDEPRVLVNGQEVSYEAVGNRYRSGGVKLAKENVVRMLNKSENIFKVWV